MRVLSSSRVLKRSILASLASRHRLRLPPSPPLCGRSFRAATSTATTGSRSLVGAARGGTGEIAIGTEIVTVTVGETSETETEVGIGIGIGIAIGIGIETGATGETIGGTTAEGTVVVVHHHRIDARGETPRTDDEMIRTAGGAIVGGPVWPRQGGARGRTTTMRVERR